LTRESPPRFDLYAELEVSRDASAEVIEAAYRTLAKRHHPDVARTQDAARPGDTNRITRLNQAREWLTDPARRKRYDAATRAEGPRQGTPNAAAGKAAAGKAAVGTAGGGSAERAPGPARRPSGRTSSPKAFGIHTAEVRQFLADLRALDEPRAMEIRDGTVAADASGYGAARELALASARGERASEWLLAREAASVIARGKLGDSPLRAEVPEVVADIAGAIAIRDLIPQADFELLLMPWTWRGERGSATARGSVTARVSKATPVSPRSTTVAAGPAAPAPVRGGRRWMTAPALSLAALVAVVAVAAAIAYMNGQQGPVADASPRASASDTAAAQPSAPPPSPIPEVSPSPAPSPTLDPARLQDLQLSAHATIGTLAAAAAIGDVKAAQAVLGDSAPNLHASGLQRATFPTTAAANILVVRTGASWVATAAADRLVSTDGSHWTFDYGDRPLAHYLGRPEHDLFWVESDGRHDLYLRVDSATLSASGLTVEVAWRFGTGDATYFQRADMVVSSITFDSTPIAMTTDATAVFGADGARLVAAISDTVERSPGVRIDIAVSNGQADTGPRTVVSTFELRRG
jgi:curved DNA-binding protein CbpA